MVRKLMGHGGLVLQSAVSDKFRVADIGGMFHRTLGGKAITNTLPTIRSEPTFIRVECVLKVNERGLHLCGVLWASDQCYRNQGTGNAGKRISHGYIIGTGHRCQIGWNWLGNTPMRNTITTAQVQLGQERAVGEHGAVASSCNDEFKGAALYEVVEAREPRASV